MLLGIPEEDQAAIRDRDRRRAALSDEGRCRRVRLPAVAQAGAQMFEEYIDWRAGNPSDDLMTELLQAEFEDETGTVRTLARDELLNFVNLLAAAGNETTTRLIGWTGKVLGEHPDQRRQIVADRGLVPQAIEEMLRFEAPSPVQARLRHIRRGAPRHDRARGQRHPALNGSANRDDRSSPTATASTSTARSTTTSPSATACTSASVRPWPGSRAGWRSTRCSSRFPDWEVDWDRAVQARTSTVRGWERLPVFTSA